MITVVRSKDFLITFDFVQSFIKLFVTKYLDFFGKIR